MRHRGGINPVVNPKIWCDLIGHNDGFNVPDGIFQIAFGSAGNIVHLQDLCVRPLLVRPC